MKLEHVRTFVEIVHLGSFRQAAKSLHRSQPALTQSIQSLEAVLGFDLFDRSTYRPTLTSAGENFYQEALSWVEQADQLKQTARFLAQGYEPQFFLSVEALAPITSLYSELSDVLVKYPQTHLKIMVESLGGPVQMLSEGKAEIAIAENLPIAQAVEAVPLMWVELVAVATPDFYHAYQPEFASDRLDQVMLAVLSDSSDEGYSFGLPEGAQCCRTNNLSSKYALIQSGLAWGRLPLHLVEQDLAKGRLVVIEQVPKKQMLLSAIRLLGKKYGPIHSACWQVLKNLSQIGGDAYTLKWKSK